jgi:DNA-binding GntR family transcriptional regulator
MIRTNEDLTRVESASNEVDNASLLNLNEKKIISKSSLRRIEISELPNKLPDFRNSATTKDNILAEWLATWIENGLNNKKLSKNDLLPKKSALANYLGISIGTVQTAIRFVEDKGHVESKQRIGTFIRDMSQENTELRKQTSKRDLAIITLKNIIANKGYKVGEPLPSSRELSKIIGSALNTTRLALEYLSSIDVVESRGCRGNKANWILKSMPDISESEKSDEIKDLESDTLVDQVERDLKDLISKRFQVNQKLPPHFELAETLKVSIKTVHDAMKRLVEQGIIKSKRGRYGTFIMRMPSDAQFHPKQENSIFASAVDASLYNYEKVERHLKLMIKENYKVGDKFPAMGKLAIDLKVSSNTIRKALQKLSDDNIVRFSRGRYGGTFIVNMPKVEELTSFTWLSINPEHVAVYRTKK